MQTGFSGCWGSVRRFLGVLAATAGRPDEARAHFEAALERHVALDAPGLVARTRCDLGELLLAHGERERGLELLAAAGAAAAELGMAGLAARADVSGAGSALYRSVRATIPLLSSPEPEARKPAAGRGPATDCGASTALTLPS